MASNSIQYIFEIIDKYTPSLRRINDQTAKFKQNIKKANASLLKLRDRLKRAGDQAGKFGRKLTTRLTLPLVAGGALLIKLASDAEETASKFATVFKSVSGESKKVMEDLRKNYGLSRLESQRLLSDTGDLLVGFGFSGKAALDLSEKVNKLAVDLASFQNLPVEQASKALTKALLGERESVKLLGISILEEDVKRKMQILSLKGMKFATQRQAKAYATFILATEQSKSALGDFARTSHQFANRMKIFRARISDVAIGFGNILLPPALKLLNIFIRLINKIDKLSPSTRKLILVLVGLAAILGPLLLAVKGLAIVFAILLSPIGLTITAIVALAGVIAFLILKWKQIKIFMEGSKIFQPVIKRLQIFIFLLKKLMATYENIINFFTKNPLSDAFKKAGEFITSPIKAIGEHIFSGAMDININAPKGVVNQVATTQKGKNFKLGTNMRES